MSRGPQSTPVRRRLVETASSLFHRRGVHATGIDAVLAEAGAAKGSLYGHFASKDALVVECVATISAAVRADVEARMAAAGDDPTAQVMVLFDLVREASATPDACGCPFQRLGSELAGSDHPAVAGLRDHRAWLHGLVAARLERLRVADIATVAHAFLALHDGAMLGATLDREPAIVSAAEAAARQLVASARRMPAASRADAAHETRPPHAGRAAADPSP